MRIVCHFQANKDKLPFKFYSIKFDSPAHNQIFNSEAMDKKAKKRIEVLRKRMDKLRQQLAGAKQQTDEPDEIQNLEDEMENIRQEIEKLKNS